VLNSAGVLLKPTNGSSKLFAGNLGISCSRPYDLLVIGVDPSVISHMAGKLAWMRSEIITAEQGSYENGEWKVQKLWNGDETDRGLRFHDKPEVVRVRLGRF
jgi:hypothetical protein